MKDFPRYERRAWQRVRHGVTRHGVTLASLSECGTRIAATAYGDTKELATIKAYRKLKDANDSAVVHCVRRGRHQH